MIGAAALRSGSSGNSTLIRNDEVRLIVDCGINGKGFAASLAQLGESTTEIDGILITHNHIDHVSGLGVILRKFRIPVYLTEKTYLSIVTNLGKFDENLIHIIAPEGHFSIKDQLVESFLVPHDSPETLAFRFFTERGDITVCTDIGSMSQSNLAKISKSRLVFLESNYDVEMLNNGPYPYRLKERIRNGHGHLSNLQCGATLCSLLQEGTEQIVLSHLSKENNHPAIAELTSVQALGEIDAVKDRDYLIQVAKRYEVSDWMQI